MPATTRERLVAIPVEAPRRPVVATPAEQRLAASRRLVGAQWVAVLQQREAPRPRVALQPAAGLAERPTRALLG